MRVGLVTALVVALLACAVPASAAVRFERNRRVRRARHAGQVRQGGLLKVGPKRAPNILVLTRAPRRGAAYFVPLAKELDAEGERAGRLWAVERRENLLEDHSVLDRGKRARPLRARCSTTTWAGSRTPSVTNHFTLSPMRPSRSPRAGACARRSRTCGGWSGGPSVLDSSVVVGGHSLGGTITSAYPPGTFGGKPGARWALGLVLHRRRQQPRADLEGGRRAAARRPERRIAVAELRRHRRPVTRGSSTPPGSLGELTDPDSPSLGQAFPGPPANLKPPMPVTTRGSTATRSDTETSPPRSRPAQAHLGHLAATGDPRGWDDAGELTPLDRYARMFSGFGLRGLDGTAWYHPAPPDDRRRRRGGRQP
jgi:hypothetical protein